MMFGAVTDHVFIDGGHTLDFTNKAFEALDHVGTASASSILPTMVQQTTTAARAEETFPWRHPHDLAALVDTTHLEPGPGGYADVAGLGGGCSPTTPRPSWVRSSMPPSSAPVPRS